MDKTGSLSTITIYWPSASIACSQKGKCYIFTLVVKCFSRGTEKKEVVSRRKTCYENTARWRLLIRANWRPWNNPFWSKIPCLSQSLSYNLFHSIMETVALPGQDATCTPLEPDASPQEHSYWLQRYIRNSCLNQTSHISFPNLLCGNGLGPGQKVLGGGRGWVGAKRGWVISFWAPGKGWVVQFSATHGIEMGHPVLTQELAHVWHNRQLPVSNDDTFFEP